jgi:superfamily II DNA or RNA helicase
MASKHSQAPYLISQGIFDSIKSFKEFEQKVSALFKMNTKAQGDAFEIFVEAYLLTQPITQCAETWLVGSIPVEVREELNLPNDSKGIDGVFKSTSDVLVPYQVKFRSNRPALGFNEVAPFLGITEKAVDRLLITNCDSIAIDVKNRTGIRSLRGVDFDQLIEDDFLVIENWLKSKPAKRAALVPDPYQIEALANISNHLQSQDRGSVVMACGTGKTLVALWAVEQSKAKSILVLLPSLTLLQQTLSEWSTHNSWGKDFSYLCVCSDPQVDLKNDEIEIDLTDVPFKIDTDPGIVKRYLEQENGKTKIVFSTYQSSQVVSQATKEHFIFDIGIFDEAHKTTGAADGRFALALKDENISIKKRLFFTATPKHYDISKRNLDGEFKFVSMDDESIYGGRAHTLSFSQAAEQGIICPYKVVVTLIDKQQVDDFALKNGITLIEGDTVKAKWVASQVAISSAIKHTNAKKIITFHSRVKTASDFASDEIYGIKKFLPSFDVFHVHGKQRSNERKDTISKFKSSSLSLITNAKCLTEGVDVPAVDMVAFVDPRHSKIDIAQAVGRAMRKPRGGNKQLGYIVVPLYAEDTDENALEAAIQSEGFDDVALIINSLLEQDSELIEIVSELKQAKGRAEVFNPQRLKGKIEVIGPYVNLEHLQSSIFTQTIERLGSSWDEWYGRLQKYNEKLGNCLVPTDFKDGEHSLGKWVGAQRVKKSKLTKVRIFKLDAIGFSWNKYLDTWNQYFDALKIFREREGNCLVPQLHMECGLSLGKWVAGQRQGEIQCSPERVKKLNSVGFIWNQNEYGWELGYSALVKFHAQHRHCNVPSAELIDGHKLGQWVVTQRAAKNQMNPLRLEKLNELDFCWDLKAANWASTYILLLKFFEREKHSSVPDNHIEDNIKLGSWVSRQRQVKSTLTESQLKKLNEINFNWDPLNEKWESSFQELVNFKKRVGHCLVKAKHVENGIKLGQWIGVQRQNKNNLSTDKLERLNQLGFSWDPFAEKWEQGFIQLSAFKLKEGHCRVPSIYIFDGYPLGRWATAQKEKKSSLDKERYEKLKKIGFF